MACRQIGDKPLSEPMMVKLPLGLNELTFVDWDSMANIVQIIFSDLYSQMKIVVFWFNFI